MYSNLEIKKDAIVVNTGDLEFHPFVVTVNGRSYFQGIPEKHNTRTWLSVTEDGHNVYEGDDVYCVNGIWAIFNRCNINKEGFDDLKSHCKFFHHKEKAEDYKRMNEPIYSANDVPELAKCGVWNERIRLHLINAIEDYKKSTK